MFNGNGFYILIRFGHEKKTSFIVFVCVCELVFCCLCSVNWNHSKQSIEQNVRFNSFNKKKLKLKLGILRYKVDFQSLQADELLDDVDLDDY